MDPMTEPEPVRNVRRESEKSNHRADPDALTIGFQLMGWLSAGAGVSIVMLVVVLYSPTRPSPGDAADTGVSFDNGLAGPIPRAHGA